MDLLVKLTLDNYMNLSHEIINLQKSKQYQHWDFYQQSFHTSVVYSGLEPNIVGVRVDEAVVKLDEVLELIDYQIQSKQTKKQYWDKFMMCLSRKEQEELGKVCEIEKLSSSLERKIINEIKEIEEAINYQF